ncbi:hypothetical protein [Halorussus aquaticus]|uniref:Uncharacterized protein n=1 Tax=Halorussus aquaticus TaxID=2953748 RepID=A0ABD5Q4A3_9EURY|nr:hypothetical protein [Halorussus aquaticus]
MTHCHNCGHTGTFVLLVQCALAVRGPDVDRDAASLADCRPDRAGRVTLPSSRDCSLAVQCPACDSTDVGVAASDLLVCYGPTTTS